MEYRPLGRSGLRVSAVAFGTSQLRLVPEAQALATLRRGFELGVNCVHTAPDYEGADDLVARAVRDSGRDVLVLSQGYGDPTHFEFLFEETCRKLGRERLELFGVACIEDRARLGENVWGRGGAIEFLQRKQREGRLGSLFCSTHGSPEYVARLLGSGIFDALMLAYNPLGFHLLSCRPEATPAAEDLFRLRDEILPMAARLGVGLLVMKPVAGGLLSRGLAFRERGDPAPGPRLRAGEVLRSILEHPAISCVVPGTASPEEAEENARAGYRDAPTPAPERVQPVLDQLRTTLCSRCGVCDSLCSQHLPVSWLFRDAYLHSYPSESFEAIDELQYFHLHPGGEATCTACPEVTCRCPAGIDVPASLMRVHTVMKSLRERALLPLTPAEAAQATVAGRLPATVVSRDLPDALAPGTLAFCRLYVENAGAHAWRRSSVRLGAVLQGAALQEVALRHDVESGARAHFAFVLHAPLEAGTYALELSLVTGEPGSAEEGRTPLVRTSVSVTAEAP